MYPNIGNLLWFMSLPRPAVLSPRGLGRLPVLAFLLAPGLFGQALLAA
jgi:hypothetical protein